MTDGTVNARQMVLKVCGEIIDWRRPERVRELLGQWQDELKNGRKEQHETRPRSIRSRSR